MTGIVVGEEAKEELMENPIPINYNEVPDFAREDYEISMEKVPEFCDERGHSHLIVYGDREDAFNIHFLTDLESRFEDAQLLAEKGKRPKMILGNKCHIYDLCRQDNLDFYLYYPFSLIVSRRKILCFEYHTLDVNIPEPSCIVKNMAGLSFVPI